MRVGVPREIKQDEHRVGLTPEAVREYSNAGHSVLVEAGAGDGIGADDEAYERAGATLVTSAAEVFGSAEMIVKVKEPQPAEWKQLRAGQILFTYLHLAADPAQARGLLDSGCVAVAYETVMDRSGGLPLLAPMSEVAGRLAIEVAGTLLLKHVGGRGILMGGVPGIAPARVVVLGGGTSGTQAARMAVGLGAEVVVVDRSLPRLRHLDDLFAGRVRTRFSTSHAIEEEVVSADVVIGAVLIPGASAPKLVSRELVARMKPGSVMMDIAVDQGGCFATSHPTTHSNPTFKVGNVIHYCVANMPGAVPLSSTYALNNATLPIGLALAGRGLADIGSDPLLASGVNIYRGRVTNKAVSESLGLPYKPLGQDG